MSHGPDPPDPGGGIGLLHCGSATAGAGADHVGAVADNMVSSAITHTAAAAGKRGPRGRGCDPDEVMGDSPLEARAPESIHREPSDIPCPIVIPPVPHTVNRHVSLNRNPIHPMFLLRWSARRDPTLVVNAASSGVVCGAVHMTDQPREHGVEVVGGREDFADSLRSVEPLVAAEGLGSDQ